MTQTNQRATPLRLLIFVAVCVVLMILDQNGRLIGIKGLILRPVLPIQSGLTSLAGGAQSVVNLFYDLGTLRQRNQDLQELADRLTVENVRLRDIEIEDANLRSLLNFRQSNPNLVMRGGQIVGRVVGRDPNFLKYLVIDLGSNQGIAAGMPVMSDVGLVGRIIEVNASSSKVLLITDPNSAVNVIVQGSRVLGVLQGVDGSNPVVNYLTQDAVISPGDIVLTSGLGESLPKGLVIGQILSVRRRDYEMFQQAEVRPTVNFGRLELVLVITDFGSTANRPPPAR
ncbi:rod shape-determining protein MreC [Candidatus Amarolinea aalborgensis]|jgi:rod shape-determining protein MreC|uniref:rod shape-determining protein MreC n=1 Tax=Candidatus Amarolinea aalborgensis TaxID=2249329 RepID=UPI003BF96E5E